MKQIDPRDFNLSPRAQLSRSGKKIIIQKHRKSRIIMKDGQQLLAMAKAIRSQEPQAKIIFETNAPICSKTTAFLDEHAIGITQLDA